MVKKITALAAKSAVIALAAVFILPVAAVAAVSLKNGAKSYVSFFVWEPACLKALAVSMFIAFLSSAGSIVVSTLAAYVFSQCNFKGKGVIFYLYIIVMMMPFQVTLLPQYIVSKTLGIYDTPAAMILPAVFSPFPAFLLTQIMKSIPRDSIEAARLDADSTLKIILRVIVPQMRGGIICAWVMIFTEQWNMVAEPLVLIETRENYPLSVLLSQAEMGEFSFAATAIFMLLPLGMFMMFGSEISEGLEEYRLK